MIPTRDSLLEQISAFLGRLEKSARYRISQAARRLEQQGIGRATAVVGRKIGRALQRKK